MKSKRIFAMAAAACMAVTGLTSMAASAASTTSSVTISYNQSTRKMTVSGKGTVTKQAVDQALKAYKLDKVVHVMSLDIKNGITAIGDRAFEGFNSLCYINFSGDMKSIGAYAFAGAGVETIELPYTLSVVGNYAFKNCTVLKDVVINSKISSWGISVLSGDKIATVYGPKTSAGVSFTNAQACAASEGRKFKSHLYGDANCDGVVNSNDATLILNFIANPSGYGIDGTKAGHMTKEGMLFADVCSTDGAGRRDGVTASDALTISKYVDKMIGSLPVKN